MRLQQHFQQGIPKSTLNGFEEGRTVVLELAHPGSVFYDNMNIS